MDDEDLFERFLQNILGVASQRARDERNNFAESFRDLRTSADKDIDAFVKEIHNSNSARTAIQRS